jgi:hypothetical protein
MALKKTVKFERKFHVQTESDKMQWRVEEIEFNAYIKVSFINGNKSQVTATVLFVGDNETFEKTYTVPMVVDNDSENFIKQAYEYLKTLPEFAGATDC